MFIWKSTYLGLKVQIKQLSDALTFKNGIIRKQEEEIVHLKAELEIARNLKAILETLSPLYLKISGLFTADGSLEVRLPDSVVQLVPDYFGGKVMKHEATKVVVLDQNGKVKEVAFTKKKPDTGYSYLLVREKAEKAK